MSVAFRTGAHSSGPEARWTRVVARVVQTERVGLMPNPPALTGALCGLGVGLMADAGLRLFCWDGDYAHVLVAHGGAILILVALGALSATIVELIKARRVKRMN